VRDASSQRSRSRKSRLTKRHAISYDVQDAVREPLNGNTKSTKRIATSRPVLDAIKLRSPYQNMKVHDAGCDFKQCSRCHNKKIPKPEMRLNTRFVTLSNAPDATRQGSQSQNCTTGRREPPENLRVQLLSECRSRLHKDEISTHIWNKAYCTVCRRKNI